MFDAENRQGKIFVKTFLIVIAAGLLAPGAALAQPTSPGLSHASGRFLPPSTMVVVTPSETITSKHMKEGDAYRFQVVNDVVESGVVVIPRGAAVSAVVAWKTGRAVGGKSGKFELVFDRVWVNGNAYKMSGTWRQEGRGNSVGALLGSMVISGRSAMMQPGQLINAFTAERISY